METSEPQPQTKVNLIPMSDKEFNKIAKESGIKYRNKISLSELKAMLGYCPLRQKQRKVEITDESGSSKVFDSLAKAARESGISNTSAIRYAQENAKAYGSNWVRRRFDGKLFFVREDHLLQKIIKQPVLIIYER